MKALAHDGGAIVNSGYGWSVRVTADELTSLAEIPVVTHSLEEMRFASRGDVCSILFDSKTF
jgi:hypothetical protein